MEKKIEVRQVFTVNYDPQSPEFKEALEGYRDCIDSDGDEESVVNRAVLSVAKYGADHMVEGVGYVEMEGRIWGSPYSGISLEEYMEDVDEY